MKPIKIFYYIIYCSLFTIFISLSFYLKDYFENRNLLKTNKKIEIKENKSIAKIKDYQILYTKEARDNFKIKEFEICPQDNNCKNSKENCKIKKNLKIKGLIKTAYIYAELSIKNKGLTSFDDLYFLIIKKNYSIKSEQRGGHLIYDDTLLEYPNDNKKYSILFYNFNNISYFPTIKDKINNENLEKNQNLMYLFQDGNKLKINTHISSERDAKEIKKMIIYYQCGENEEGKTDKCEIY